MTDAVFRTENLDQYFYQNAGFFDSILGRDQRVVRAVDDVNIELYRDEPQAIIGESGCGKTTLLRTLSLLYEPTNGTIYFDGEDVSDFDRHQMKAFRSEVQIIFQDPFDSLDPKLTVRESLLEPLKIHKMDEKERRIHEVCEQVELQPPDKYLDRLPRQLSGGERQRVAIARSLIVEPSVILADEPVSMLDVSTQASILKLLSRLIDDLDVALLYISHDLSTVSYISDVTNVMYLGRVVETAPTEELLADPKHPYSEALINAVSIPDPHHQRERTLLPGTPEEPTGIGTGCRFKDRCPERMDICDETPCFVETGEERNAACHLYYDHETKEEAVESPSQET